MSYDVLIERNAIREIRKFPANDIKRMKDALKKLPDFQKEWMLRNWPEQEIFTVPGLVITEF